jgi:hypothetical protein
MKTKIIIVLVVLLQSVVLVYDWYSVKVSGTTVKEELKPNEKEKTIIDQKRKTVTKLVRKKDGTVEKSTVEGVRKVDVTISNDDKLTITARNRGFLFDPGVSVFYSKDKINLGLDIQWAYWRRYGFSGGFGVSTDHKCSGYFSGSYNFYSQSSVFIGVNDNLKPIVGFKVTF